MQPYLARRRKLSGHLLPGILILPTAFEQLRNNDCLYPYRFDSNFYYLTGFTEPEAVLVQIMGDKPKSILFCRDKHIEREIWNGKRFGPDAAKTMFGFDEAYSIDTLNEKLLSILQNQARVYFPLGQHSAWDTRITALLNQLRASVRNGITCPSEIVDIRPILGEMRLIKEPHEVDILREAARINKDAHYRAMRATQPGLFEYSVEAEIQYEYTRQGSRFPAYSTIVAGGANACILHYIENSARLNEGELLLIDAGCEVGGYASDVTRTFPINGKFSPAQKEVYDIVLTAQLAAIEAVIPNQPWDVPHQIALRILAQGLIDLKLCQGSIDSIIETRTYQQFYMHKTSHWMGLDVHDIGQYSINDMPRKLASGMVMTIEPGLYIRKADNVPSHLENIGIRIEDDILVTQTGNENLTAAIPKTTKDIETCMKDK